MKLFKPDDFEDMFRDATFPSVQMKKACEIANEKTERLMIYMFFIGVYSGLFIWLWFCLK